MELTPESLIAWKPKQPQFFNGKSDQLLSLQSWINWKMETYAEGSRKGVPRGERPPIPPHKFHAALLGTALGGSWIPDLMTLAQVSKSSYPVCRKWRSEQEFLDLTDSLANEYLYNFLGAFLDMGKQLFHWRAQQIQGKKDNYGRKHESGYAAHLVGLMDLADEHWGLVLDEKTHALIERLLPRHELKHTTSLLRLLDLICVLQSRKKIKVPRGYFIRTANELREAHRQLNYDLTVTIDRNFDNISRTYADAITSLSMLLVNKLCQIASYYYEHEDKDHYWASSYIVGPSVYETVWA